MFNPNDLTPAPEPADPYLPAHLSNPRRPRAEIIAICAATGVIVLGILIALLYLGYRGQQAEIHAKSAQVNAAVGAATSANASLSAAGLPTVPVPTSAAAPTATVTVSGPQGDQGSAGPGPSTAQVSAAVAAYCESHACSTPPSSSDVASAVAAYCAAHNACQGATGSTGPQGAAGQNATTDQIAAAVQNYCAANNSCQGPTGAQGPPGATGPEIPSFTFTDELGITYTCSAPDYQCQPQ